MNNTKTKEDIAVLREGGKRHAAILKELAGMVRPGLDVSELDARAAKLIAEGGDEAAFLNYKPRGAPRPYPASICVSVNDEVVHGIPLAGRVLREGDIVSIDLGLRHGGLITDAAVTVGVGHISDELRELLEATWKALYAGIKAAKGGRHLGDIGEAIELVGAKGNYGIVEDLSGHGVGYEVHEPPFVPNYGEKGHGEKLVPGMVLAIEPMFNIGGKEVIFDKTDGYTVRTKDGSPSAHFEHTIVITKGNPEILTAM